MTKMEKLTIENIERYLDLNNELVFEDPYVLKTTKDEFLDKYLENLKSGSIEIFILSYYKEDIGFIEIYKNDNIAIIEKIYARKEYSNYKTYKNMLEFIHEYYCNTNIGKVEFVGVNDRFDLIQALEDDGYKMGKEHIQMEKEIVRLCKNDLTIEYKTFYEIDDKKWIFNFIKECMKGSVLNYKAEEINELTHINSDLIFVLYENNKPIGFVISYINEKRNKQENKKVVYIEEIAILKEFRNKGYGRKTIEFVLDKGKKRGMDIARLHVYRHNETAYSLYKKLGFNEIKSIGYWYLSIIE